MLLIFPSAFVGLGYIADKLPDVYYISPEEKVNFSLYPFSVVSSSENSQTCLNNQICPLDKSEKYPAKLMFMNLFPIKTVEIQLRKNSYVIPCGIPFGVKLYTKGVLVIGTSNVSTKDGITEPWKTAGIKKGDVIAIVENKEVTSNNELENIIQNSEGKELNLKVLRGNTEFYTTLKPVKSIDDNKYRIGMWVRDSSAGIGTLTFCEKESKIFAGLGHGICDTDTSELLPLSHGDIVEAVITNTVRGCRGAPGELKGCFTNPDPIGQIYTNNETGLYGTLRILPENTSDIPVIMKQNVRKGPAKILTTIEGNSPELYDVNIDSINYDITAPTKNIKISVTDPRLLGKTGGIVQGMSGSPLIQNGGLIGAVTHVFVNNPAKGYAIFAETMLTNSNILLETKYKNIS